MPKFHRFTMEWKIGLAYNMVYYKEMKDLSLEIGKSYICGKSRADGKYIVFKASFEPPIYTFETKEELLNHFMDDISYLRKTKLKKLLGN